MARIVDLISRLLKKPKKSLKPKEGDKENGK